MKKLTDPILRARRTIVIADLLSKAEAEDWHGTADAAMDLREIDAQLEVLASWPTALAQPVSRTPEIDAAIAKAVKESQQS